MNSVYNIFPNRLTSVELQTRSRELMSYVRNRKRNYEPVVPLNIFQTWHSKYLPSRMFKAVLKLKRTHPRFNHQLFDDNECRAFISEHFESDIVRCFSALIPGAYKADLWRYCILYIKGGIYLDIKFQCANAFHLIELTEREYFVQDIDKNCVYNAFMVSKPGNPVLLECINRIKENVRNKYYGGSSLDPTGPRVLADAVRFHCRTDDILLTHRNDNGNKLILFNNVPILETYSGYYDENKRFNKVGKNYDELWHQRAIYRL